MAFKLYAINGGKAPEAAKPAPGTSLVANAYKNIGPVSAAINTVFEQTPHRGMHDFSEELNAADNSCRITRHHTQTSMKVQVFGLDAKFFGLIGKRVRIHVMHSEKQNIYTVSLKHQRDIGRWKLDKKHSSQKASAFDFINDYIRTANAEFEAARATNRPSARVVHLRPV